VWNAGVVHQSAGSPPAKPFEECHVRRLDECLHIQPPAECRRGHGKLDQRCPEALVAVAWQHGQPIAFPPTRECRQRVQPDGPADDAVGKANDVDRRRVLIMGVPVPAIAPEQPLLDDEDLLTDPEMGSSLIRRDHSPAGQPEPVRTVGQGASGW